MKTKNFTNQIINNSMQFISGCNTNFNFAKLLTFLSLIFPASNMILLFILFFNFLYTKKIYAKINSITINHTQLNIVTFEKPDVANPLLLTSIEFILPKITSWLEIVLDLLLICSIVLPKGTFLLGNNKRILLPILFIILNILKMLSGSLNRHFSFPHHHSTAFRTGQLPQKSP